VKDRACPELECQVCYALLFDPVTTHCGHTFCRVCLQRVLDHAQPCPSCRQNLQLPSVLPPQLSNKRLTEILVGLCPDDLAQRAATASLEEQPGTAENELITPIFVCTTSFPGMPTVLYIFEPKYRLMIRRAWEGDHLFGMVLSNPSGIPQGELGSVQFMQHGTLLRIVHVQMNDDGTSSIWTVGVSKFTIRRWGMRDGYIVANTERLDDIPIAEEEAVELVETQYDAVIPSRRIHNLSTEALRRICEAAIQQFSSTNTDHYDRMVVVFGQPPADAATIPYWICSVLPIDPMLKYHIISSTSVRSRLKICVTWIQSAQNQRWFSTPNCTMF
jgi:Lon protease-like protein